MYYTECNPINCSTHSFQRRWQNIWDQILMTGREQIQAKSAVVITPAQWRHISRQLWATWQMSPLLERPRYK